MKTIGVRELRQNASAYLREVERGRTVAVTSRGRVVARLVPVRAAGRRGQLIDRGRLAPASSDLLDLGAPLSPAAGTDLPSRRLAEARDRER